MRALAAQVKSGRNNGEYAGSLYCIGGQIGYVRCENAERNFYRAIVDAMFVGGLPIDVRLAPDGRLFYVANQGLGGVSVIDPRAMRQVAFLATGRGAHGLAVSRDARRLYVTNRLAGTLSVVDFARRRVVATWQIGGSPDMIAVSPDGRQLWISNRYSGTVSVVNARSGRVIATIRTGGRPHGLAFFPQPGRFSLGHNGVYR